MWMRRYRQQLRNANRPEDQGNTAKGIVHLIWSVFKCQCEVYSNTMPNRTLVLGAKALYQYVKDAKLHTPYRLAGVAIPHAIGS